jgi:hypothetical protein
LLVKGFSGIRNYLYRLYNGNIITNKMLAMTQAAIMAGNPRLIHITEVMGVRVLSDNEATTILAEDPMMVPLPPKPAPNARAHHKGAVLIHDDWDQGDCDGYIIDYR